MVKKKAKTNSGSKTTSTKVTAEGSRDQLDAASVPTGDSVSSTKEQDPTQKHPGGRPTKYKPEYCDDIIRFFDIEPYEYKMVLMSTIDGKEVKHRQKVINDLPFFSQFARSIEVTHDTLLEWCKVHEEFSESYKKAKGIQKEILITNGLRGNYQVAFAIFTAKNLTNMRDQKDIKVEGEIKILTIEEKRARINRLYSLFDA